MLGITTFVSITHVIQSDCSRTHMMYGKQCCCLSCYNRPLSVDGRHLSRRVCTILTIVAENFLTQEFLIPSLCILHLP